MWKPEHRIAADRSGLRYPSDPTGAEWAVVEPMIPPAKPGGRKRTIDVRDILNGIFYVLWTGCQWQALPKDLPPKSTAWAYFDLWTWDGTLERIHHALYVAVREQAGREASPTTPIIDSQSVKGAQKGGPCSTRRASMLSSASTASACCIQSSRRSLTSSAINPSPKLSCARRISIMPLPSRPRRSPLRAQQFVIEFADRFDRLLQVLVIAQPAADLGNA
jgi:transposase